MSDETAAKPATMQPGEYPPPHFPTVFADGVQSLITSPTVVKYFLMRFEPSFTGDGKSQMQAFAQVVMPLEAFASMSVFFRFST
jgi:hypothetical protein